MGIKHGFIPNSWPTHPTQIEYYPIDPNHNSCTQITILAPIAAVPRSSYGRTDLCEGSAIEPSGQVSLQGTVVELVPMELVPNGGGA